MPQCMGGVLIFPLSGRLNTDGFEDSVHFISNQTIRYVENISSEITYPNPLPPVAITVPGI